MRRKLICLLLCLTAVFSLTFVGCGETEEDDGTSTESSARAATSLNMWVICDKPVSIETEKAVEDAFNELTQAKYTTKVDFVFLTEDEYFTALDEKLTKAAELKSSASVDVMLSLPGEETAETVETTAETMVNELGQRLLKYPDIGEGQVDIVFIAGKELHDRYVSEGKIQSLETNLNSTSKVLKDYIYPSFLTQAKHNNNTYAIPTNHKIGDYTFLLINKEMAQKYYIDLSTVNTFAACADLIAEIGKNETIAPVLEYKEPLNIQYWIDYGVEGEAQPMVLTVGNTEVDVFGEKQKAPVAPVEADGNVMVPFEFFAKAMGAKYAWDEENAVATATYGARDIVVTEGSATATVLDKAVAMGAAAYTDETTGKLMVPVSFAADSMCANATVENGKVTVKLNEYNGSVLVSSYSASASTANRTPMTSVFGNDAFTKHMILMQRCKDNGWFAEDSATATDFGVAIVEGDYGDIEKYGDKYEVKVLSYPKLTEDTLYESMFAVTSYTANIDRAMEIITFINTDVEAKNILQYGVEGVHFEFDEQDNFVKLNDDYCMNNLYTGNVFLAYNTDENTAEDFENAKKANLESGVSPYYGLDSVWGTVDKNILFNLRALSNDFFDRMSECDNAEELAEFFTEAKKAVETNSAFTAACSTAEDASSPYAVYIKWGTSNKLWAVE